MAGSGSTSRRKVRATDGGKMHHCAAVSKQVEGVMPKKGERRRETRMYRVQLTDAQHAELERRAHDPRTKPRTRDRLEMVRLAHAGWSVPKTARHFRCHEETVGPWIKAFL